MVFTFGIHDGLSYAFRGLSGVTLQPQVPRKANPNQNVVIQAEIDLAGPLRVGPVPGTKPQAPVEIRCGHLQTEVPVPKWNLLRRLRLDSRRFRQQPC